MTQASRGVTLVGTEAAAVGQSLQLVVFRSLSDKVVLRPPSPNSSWVRGRSFAAFQFVSLGSDDIAVLANRVVVRNSTRRRISR